MLFSLLICFSSSPHPFQQKLIHLFLRGPLCIVRNCKYLFYAFKQCLEHYEMIKLYISNYMMLVSQYDSLEIIFFLSPITVQKIFLRSISATQFSTFKTNDSEFPPTLHFPYPIRRVSSGAYFIFKNSNIFPQNFHCHSILQAHINPHLSYCNVVPTALPALILLTLFSSLLSSSSSQNILDTAISTCIYAPNVRLFTALGTI